ncbi:histone H1 [Mucilaginibacter litoreus]|uniref:Histone H1 n=1 Tax=Mucilaginibacter litoreus TaxID=1048221 RepID=A0ABW3AWN4_9SPHI
MEKLAELKALVETAEKEGTAFYEKHNNAAGTRLRNALQQIKVLATDLRKDVTETKNAAKA